MLLRFSRESVTAASARTLVFAVDALTSLSRRLRSGRVSLLLVDDLLYFLVRSQPVLGRCFFSEIGDGGGSFANAMAGPGSSIMAESVTAGTGSVAASIGASSRLGTESGTISVGVVSVTWASAMKLDLKTYLQSSVQQVQIQQAQDQWVQDQRVQNQ